MKNLLFVITIVLMTISSQETSAQTNEPTGTNSSEENKLEITSQKVELKEEKVQPIDAEVILTPEQQGFTKVEYSPGKFVYRKETNGIITEYFPEN